MVCNDIQGPSNCVVGEEVPEDAPEPAEGEEEVKVTFYTYSFGDEKRTGETVEMFVSLVERGVNMLIDPLHLEDMQGLQSLAAALSEKAPDFVLGGNTMYNNDASLVAEAAAAAVDPDDGETRPWASCVTVDMYEAASVSKAAHVAKAMFSAKGRVILRNANPHVAVGLGVDYVHMGALIGERISEYNEYCRIEQYLKENKCFAP